MATANVNRPTNIKEKDADINRKLQIYGIFRAFKAGKVPSNDQIDVALNSFLQSNALSKPSTKLSDDGKLLVEDTREVVRLAKNLLLSKNDGNLVQDFIWQTTRFDAKSVQGPKAPINKDAAQKDGEEALQGLRTLGTLLITNGQFRKLLKDSSILLRDMAGDAAGSAAGRLRPSDDDLAQIDHAAEDNTWHEAPKFNKDDLKKQAQGLYKGNAKKDAQDVADSARAAGAPASGDGRDANLAAGHDAARSTLQQKLDKNIDPETQENLRQKKEEQRRKAKEYFNKKMPAERKDQIIFRLKKMVIECQQHTDYSQAIQSLLRLARTYGEHGRSYGKESSGSLNQARSGFAAAEADLRTLIERFANGTSTSNLWKSIGQIYDDAQKDDELKFWFKNMDRYINRLLLEQGYVLEEQSTRDWDVLYQQGRYLLREKYKSHTDNVIDEIKFVGDQFDKDPQNKQFGLAVQKLFKDLGSNADGKSEFKPHLVKDLFDVILPSILRDIAYIPIPRIEYSDPGFDAVIENLILESDNFMPNVAELVSNNNWKWGRRNIANRHQNMIDLKVSGIQMDLRDVSYHIKRKTGFLKITDTGVADILLPGEGFSFRMKVSTADKKDSQNFFKVEKVDVDFKSLNVKLKKSKFKGLFAIFKPILLRALRPALQKAVEKAIKDQCNEFDRTLYEIKKEAEAAGETPGEDGKKTSFFKRFYDASQQRALKNKQEKEKLKKDKKEDNKKINITMTDDESIFPALKLPGGVSSKATEYKELALKGEKWESPVFSIGKASKSTDIPSAPQIVNKARGAANTANGNGLGATGNGVATGNGLQGTGKGLQGNGDGLYSTGTGLHANGTGLHAGNGIANGSGLKKTTAPALDATNPVPLN
ncbi:hypothetical protein ISF_01071 [Cordyceps fumosorosea ARSEF 2679]|uniref:Bactericidal permeability-increasing protein, alpha/beta domain protein n=1 Tax=Cordyceps fumosorosea (strain ARSEF 2679) TaxID=1081104 RepID=A0A168EST4_CORFA|nr:hypothetical protein ISF_01071 [Cordyceps fumosorosea ARSEF 2679]OAA74170.1 hypothetical protein ISF_01071 [Cordyceps fumosorosea ARSEF 2679]